ncbi:hypothetical protein IHV25_07510 [Phaeovibrio sulfidiphilus]|uniref:Phage neck terminator protein gp12-like domain-containing protein n=1 Tax=Phaeovibrio sulfidiphilus TaxID=1220600 RepID=A0A8J6YZT7_9PROT|nr:hypothetical protein [Phaeovibrio sulfidiphilus]MBE1237493.1 hypothetical protein [Phaeovibrio sulfidiphilus]
MSGPGARKRCPPGSEPVEPSRPVPDVYGAVHDFLTTFIVDPPCGAVLRSRQNRVPLPGGHSDFVLMTVLSETRRGSNVHEMDPPSEAPSGGSSGGLSEPPSGPLQVRKLVVCDMRLEVHARNPERARQVASLIELWSNDPAGVAFFRPRGISVIGCSAPTDDSQADETRQYVCRFALVLRLEYWVHACLEVPFFDHVRLSVDPVDVRFSPTLSPAGSAAKQE